MKGFGGGSVVVFHAGALGDYVLTWPLLRALRRGGAEVVSVARASHAELAARELGVRGLSSERAWVTALWREGGVGAARDRLAADVVVSFVADGGTEAGRIWLRNAASALGACEVVSVGPPGTSERAALWARTRVGELGTVEPRLNAGGPAVLHVGAGGAAKVWPMERWAELKGLLEGSGRKVELLAGPVERERHAARDAALFRALGGRYIEDLDGLADRSRGAGVFVGADTGPTHLAAQLGVPTVALFGPTDPGLWAPVGPCVMVIRAGDGRVAAITAEQVLRAVEETRG
ncbi:MAG: glycosyltransferase family 9 protein [Phycisphaerales bacterium]